MLLMASNRNEKRHRTASADVCVTHIGKSPRTSGTTTTNTIPTTLGAVATTTSPLSPTPISDDIDLLNKSLTNLQWLCDMRLHPNIGNTTPPYMDAHPFATTYTHTTVFSSVPITTLSTGVANTTTAMTTNDPPTATEDMDQPHTRPDCSYAELICEALEKLNRDGGVSLNEIYTAIMDRHPYYKTAEPSWKVISYIVLGSDYGVLHIYIWPASDHLFYRLRTTFGHVLTPFYVSPPQPQNSIRYNLSQNKLFCKAPTQGNTKGVMWMLASRARLAINTCAPPVPNISVPAAPSKRGKKQCSASSSSVVPTAPKTSGNPQNAIKKSGKTKGKAENLVIKISPPSPVKRESIAEVDEGQGKWEEIEEIYDSLRQEACTAPKSECSDDDWCDVAPHPWSGDGPGELDTNLVAGLASCLSIFPLSGSALAAESMNGGSLMGMDFAGSSLHGSIDLSRSLFDVIAAQDEAPMPKDWL